jgi:protein-disulfide isomerase
MSKRNSKQAKANARERLRVERERQARKAKIRRQFMVAGGVVVALGVAAGVAVAVDQASKPNEWKQAPHRALVEPAHSSGKNGSSIVIGDAKGKKTVKVYEDMRCPYCAQFEQTSGKEFLQGEKDGKYNISYTMGTFLDTGNVTGSANALSALGAALNVSKDAFLQYHTLLYSKGVHPDETKDTFASDSFLLKQAQKIPALKNNKKFETAVKKGTYDKWALDMGKQFTADGIQGTPTIKVDGQDISSVQDMTAAQFQTALDNALAGKPATGASPSPSASASTS